MKVETIVETPSPPPAIVRIELTQKEASALYGLLYRALTFDGSGLHPQVRDTLDRENAIGQELKGRLRNWML
jgi:hypothetical protein